MNIGELTATLGIDDSALMAATRKLYDYKDAAQTNMGSANNSIRQHTGIIQGLQQQLEWLREKQAKAFTVPELQYYNQEIQQTKNTLKEMEMVGVSSMNNMGNATKSLGSEIRDISYTLRILRSGIASIFALGGAMMVFNEGWKVYKNIMESTGETTRTFQEHMTGVRFEMDEIKRSIATGNFGGFVDRLAQAAEHGRDLENQLELVYNMSLQLKLVVSDINLEASKELLIARNHMNTLQIREEAARKYLSLQQQIGSEEEKVAKQGVKAALDASSVQASGLDPKRIRWYADHAGAVESDREALQRYNEMQSEVQRLQFGINASQVEAERTDQQKTMRLQYLQDELKKTDPLVKEMAKDYEQWMMITGTAEKPGDKQALIDAYSKLNDVLTRVNMSSSRMTMTLSQIMGSMERKKENPFKKFLDEYDAQLKQTTENMKENDPIQILQDKVDSLNYRKLFMYASQVNTPLMEVQAQLADIAVKDSIFYTSLDKKSLSLKVVDDQIKFLNKDIQNYLAEGKRPGFPILDAYITKLNELTTAQLKATEAQRFGNIAAKEFDSALNSNIDSAKSFGDAMRQAVINTIAAYIAEAITANVAKAVEKSTSWWGAILAGAAAGAATKALFSSIVPKFAEGGRVPQGYPNDTYPALLTSGEIVTPANQVPSVQTTLKGDVVFRISGYELLGLLQKQSQKNKII